MIEEQKFYIVERESRVFACAFLEDLGYTGDGFRVAELGSFVVDKGTRKINIKLWKDHVFADIMLFTS